MADFHTKAQDWLKRYDQEDQKIGRTYYGNGLVLLTAPVDGDDNESIDPVKLRALHTKVVSTQRMASDVHVLLRHEGNCIQWNHPSDDGGELTEIKGSIGAREGRAQFYSELNQMAHFDVTADSIATTIAVPSGFESNHPDARSTFHVRPTNIDKSINSDSNVIRSKPTVEKLEHQDNPQNDIQNINHVRISNETEAWTVVDIAILTVLQEEYVAVLDVLDSHWPDRGTDRKPNLYGWELGEIKNWDSSGNYKIVIGLAGHAGELSGQDIVSATIRRWKPKGVLLVGIAGGIDGSKVKLGDVIISNIIHGYEYGKIDTNFSPRDDLTYKVSKGLVRQAQAFIAKQINWQEKIIESPPDGLKKPKEHFGAVASGDKVIDNPRHPFFAEVKAKWPKILAVEMEGVGAAHAIYSLAEEGRNSPWFLMVRGISDLPSENIYTETDTQTEQTTQRDLWKPYASATAARFAVEFVRHNWPSPP